MNGTLIRQTYREFIIPLLLTSSAFSPSSLLQNAMVGQSLDDSALSAIGLTSPPMMFLEIISFLFSVGGVTCATAWLSKLDVRRAKLSFTLAVAFRDTDDGRVDFFMCVADDQVTVRFRDNGAAFNPVEYTPPQNIPYITDGVELLTRMADSLRYSRQLSFNTTTLTFTRKAGERASSLSPP